MRPRARCPRCGSLERHRLAWLYLLAETDLVSPTTPKRMLHIAPEPSLKSRLAQEPQIAQLTADLDPTGVMVQMDVTDIQYPDNSFDVIYCSHVLEHVPDDVAAMREFVRVLAPNGWAILQVPIWDAVTDEDPNVTDEAERTRRFGQRDHVRRYGRDYPERLARAGFQVTVDPYPRRIGRACVERFGLTLQEEIHLGRKLAGVTEGSVTRLLTDLVRAQPGPQAVVGRVEQVQRGVVSGWAWKPAAPEIRVEVRAILDGADVGGDVADLARVSLVEAGVGDGRYGFRLTLPESPTAGGHHNLRIEAEGGVPLPPATGFSSAIGHGGDPWYAIDVAHARRYTRA
jgi:SAM-dependent methyltransferase